MLEIHEKDKADINIGIILREFLPIVDEDFYSYTEWLRNPEITKYIGRKEYLLTIDIDEILEYVKNLARSPNDSFFKIIYEDKFIGTFKVGHINWETRTADMGIMIGDISYRRKGLSIRTMRVGMEYAFNMLGLWKITGGCLSGNEGMKKCFEKCGFKQEACIRNYMYVNDVLADHILFGMLKNEYKETINDSDM